MNHTVVGLFEDNAQAQRAVERLQAIGFPAGNINVARRRDQGADVKTEPGENQEWVGTSKIHDNNLIRFFKSLFSDSDDDMPDRYSGVSNSGNAIVSVMTRSREEAERAADILDECGAINVDEQAASRRTGEADSRTAPAQPTATERERTTPLTEASQSNEDSMGDRGRVRTRSQIIENPLDADLHQRDDSDTLRDDAGLDRNRPGSSGF